jgi:hypothetical protein
MAVGLIDLPESAEIRPGESKEVEIDFLPSPELRVEIRPGRERRIQEGGQLVGLGTVLEVLE